MSVRKKTDGFSIVELMVAMLATSILALAVGSMLVFGWISWKRNNDSVNMQRDASLAFSMMAKEIRMSNISDVTVGSSLECSNDHGTIGFVRNGGHLDMLVDGVFRMRLVRDRVAFFNTAKTTGGLVSITLNVDAGTDLNDNTLEIATRN